MADLVSVRCLIFRRLKLFGFTRSVGQPVIPVLTEQEGIDKITVVRNCFYGGSKYLFNDGPKVYHSYQYNSITVLKKVQKFYPVDHK